MMAFLKNAVPGFTKILFRDGKELDRNIGLPNPKALEKLVVKHLG